MAIQIANFNFPRGDSFLQHFALKNCPYRPDEVFFSVKKSESQKPLIKKSLQNGIMLFQEDKDVYHYILNINALESEKLKSKQKYVYDIEIILGSMKKTVLTGNVILEKTYTNTKDERR